MLIPYQGKKMQLLKYNIIPSPVGSLKIVVKNEFLVAILWDNDKPGRVKLVEMMADPTDSLIRETEKQLKEYFLKQRKTFDLPLQMDGTPFQKEVWKLLCQIPYGETWSYKDLALKIDNPNAVRAVGSANGRNPISIIVPCHRVIASNGSLAGFAGGIDRKKLLLDLESISYTIFQK